jgi:hypothetical protein
VILSEIVRLPGRGTRRLNVEPNVEPNLEDVQKQVINTTNKNAYEIRADVLGMALDWIKHKHIPNSVLSKKSEERVLDVAPKRKLMKRRLGVIFCLLMSQLSRCLIL